MSHATTFGALPQRRREKKKISDVFDITMPAGAANAMVEVYVDRTEFVPAVNPTYVFDTKSVKKVLQWLSGRYKKNLMLTGPTGCGKSSLVEQVAARLGIEVFRIGCHGKMEFPEMLGTNQLVNAATGASADDDGLLKKAANALKALFKGVDEGETILQFFKRVFSGNVITQYLYGPMIQAASRFEGGIVLIDEVNFLHPSTIGGLNGVLDEGPILIPETAEIVWPKAGFRIAVTGNSLDGDEQMALHKGVQRMNVAFLQRFLTIKCDYMAPENEARHLHKLVAKVPGHIVSTMCATADESRKAFKAGIIETVISTRILETWAKLVESDQTALRDTPDVHLSEMLAFAGMDAANSTDSSAITLNLQKSITANPAPVAKAGTTAAAAPAGPVTVNLFVSENAGNPKLWGVFQDTATSAETLFSGLLVTGSITSEPKVGGFLAANRSAMVNPAQGNAAFHEIAPFTSLDPMADLVALQAAYKMLVAGSKPQLEHRIATAMKEMLPHLSRNDLLKNVVVPAAATV
ncbi:AAA family ATPase [Ottowia sp.]|uniref:AAA family ATPase n=1 Tax=Ottowia sp. TaxID=1898956 RepID=UPI0025EE53DA|nr:AAA family ATPase [Ottowia sp.]MBK6616103.1 AAA family ATPase [Ottowia sp.]